MSTLSDFLTLGIRSNLNQILKNNGFYQPTSIQEKTIPILLKGKDVIAQAQTGTGKTLAFILPIIQRVDTQKTTIQGLIIAPTRELAMQITSEAKKLTDDLDGIHVLAVYGGQDVEAQVHKLKKSIHLVIGTPGRLLDHMRRGTIDLSQVSMLVLDEADQMLHMGFLTEVEAVIHATKGNRQTLLFSATMPSQIQSLALNYMNNPSKIQIKTPQITLKEIRQRVVETTDRTKQSNLCSIIDQYRPYLAIIFCRTKRRVSKLNEALQGLGYNSEELHGDLSQAKREDVMRRFREGQIQLLVATDVAARGLDIEGVTHVFNYDIPHDVESYIHRIGRTGRAGGKGVALTFVSPKDKSYLEMIEKGVQLKIEKRKPPRRGS